jgi:hypothetical protein
MAEPNADEILRRIDSLISQVRESEDPYPIACDVADAASRLLVTDLIACGVHMVWSALNDRWELKEDERADAESMMRRAAAEWLSTDGDDARLTLLDHWQFDILGYKRHR